MITEAMKKDVRDYYSRISTKLPGFRSRLGQREMIAAISNALGRARMADTEVTEGQNIVVVEGRTGVGKTVGYLVPALAMARTMEKKIIVSTATVALQEQLYGRDLPELVKHLDRPVTLHLAKGRRRYVCTDRLNHMSGNADQESFDGMNGSWDRRPEEGEIHTLRDLNTAYANKSWSGDRDELKDVVSDDLWNRVSTDSPGCTGQRCPRYSDCPYQSARAAMFKADLIVTNHDFVLSCLASGSTQLPAMEESVVIFDEAHHLPKVAIARFALNTPLLGSVKWIDRVPALFLRISGALVQQVPVNAAEDAARNLVVHLNEFSAALSRPDVLDAKGVHRYKFGMLDPASAAESEAISTHATSLAKFGDELEDEFNENIKAGSISSSTGEAIMRDLAPVMARIHALAEFWRNFSTPDKEGVMPSARWIQRTADGRELTANFSPISASHTLTQHIWKKASAVVLASATLRTLNSFDFFLKKTGLAFLPRTTSTSVTSPFDYQVQGELHVPKMKADPKDAQAHTDEIISVLPQVLSNTSAGGLALFASRKQMQAVYDALPNSIKVDVLVQGSKSRTELLNEHTRRVKAGGRSILFGLAGLGEGLDLPGDLCQHVIIAKLPFSPPDSPLEEATSEWIESKGGNPFALLFLPNVGLTLTQWVGRLVRSETDHGRITILDNRVVTKGYGRQLIASLPDFKRVAA